MITYDRITLTREVMMRGSWGSTWESHTSLWNPLSWNGKLVDYEPTDKMKKLAEHPDALAMAQRIEAVLADTPSDYVRQRFKYRQLVPKDDEGRAKHFAVALHGEGIIDRNEVAGTTNGFYYQQNWHTRPWVRYVLALHQSKDSHDVVQ